MILTILGIILKVTGIVLSLLWLVFTQWSVRKAKGWKENLSMQRWFVNVAPLGVFGIYTQWIMFFFAYPFRNLKFRPFSWWLDDGRLGNYKSSGWAQDYYEHLNGRKETFWIAYWWHMRNMIWNLQNKKIFKLKPQIITIGNQNIHIVRMIEDTLTNLEDNRTKLDVDGIYGIFAGLKYWKNGVSTWQTMNGEEISKQKSIVGTGFYFLEGADQQKPQLNWTYTQTKKVKT